MKLGSQIKKDGDKYKVISKEEVEEEKEWEEQNKNYIDGEEAVKPSEIVNNKNYSYKNPIVPEGFSRVNTDVAKWNDEDKDGNPDGWNNGLVIQDENENQFVWVPVDGKRILYDENINISYDMGDSEYYNQSIMNSKAYDNALPDGVTSENEQIEKYGGFYVGRYEAGLPDELANKEDMGEYYNVAGKPVIKKNRKVWNYISPEYAKTNAENMYKTENVKSGLIRNKMWNAISGWILSEEQEKNGEDAVDKITGFEAYEEIKNTGVRSERRYCNIYDFVGNVGECIDATSDENKKTTPYRYTASANCYEHLNSTGTSSVEGFRVVLYIK